MLKESEYQRRSGSWKGFWIPALRVSTWTSRSRVSTRIPTQVSVRAPWSERPCLPSGSGQPRCAVVLDGVSPPLPRQPPAPLAVCEHPAPWCSRLSWEEGPCCPPQQSEGSRAELAPVLEQSPPLRPHGSLPWAQAAALCPRPLLPGLLLCPLRVLPWALSVPPRSSGWRPACSG